MQLNKVLLTVLLIGVVSYSCIEEFTPDTGSYEDRLFVEAFVSQDPDLPHQVIIARTKPINYREPKIIYNPRKPPYKPPPENLSGADVRVYCDDGTISFFVETAQGVYTDPNHQLTLEEGKRYKLWIETNDHTRFESGYEELRSALPIDSIGYAVKQKKETDAGLVSSGYQFQVNSHSGEPDPIFLRYVMSETFMYSVPYASDYIWSNSRLTPFENFDSIYCYKTNLVPGIFLASSEGLAENRVRNANLNYVSQYGDQLTIRYSILVYQMNINRSAYSFWEDLNTLLFQTGGLYETQPFRISGNVFCTSDPDLSITGVFEVAAVSKQRRFVSRPPEFAVYPYYCTRDTVGTQTFPWSDLPSGSYISEVSEGIFMTGPERCYACTARGGTVTRPSFWTF